MKVSSVAISALMLLFLTTVFARCQEWTRFRGPNGSGISTTKTIPTKITDSDINWKVELPGSGHSSPVLWGDQIFLTTTGDDAGGISVLCLGARDGQLRWRKDFSLTPFARHKFNSFASASPVVDNERVYVVWNEPEHLKLTALKHDGTQVWQRDFGPFVSQHGCGMSPILFENKVILGNEQDDAKVVKEKPGTGISFVIAVEKTTGKTLWQTPRKSAVVPYATPCVYQPAGAKPSLVFASQAHGIYALSPETGEPLWDYEKAFDKRAVSSPIIAGNIILGSCGSGGGGSFVTAIKAGGLKAGQQPELAYQMKKSAPYVPTGVTTNGMVWLWSDGGIVTCLEAGSGTIHYQERVGGNYFGSPVWVDGRLFCVSTAGELVVVEASDKFNVLHRYALNELCHSTPAVALGRMYIHTEKHLASIGGR